MHEAATEDENRTRRDDTGTGRGPRARALLVGGALVVAVLGVGVAAALTGRAAGTEPSDAVGGAPVAEAPEDDPAVAAETPSSAPVETNGVQQCTFVGFEGTPIQVRGDDGEPEELGGLEGWWNSTPVSDAGGWLDVERWPRQILDHPATVTVETTTGTVLESFDRRTCTGVADWTAPDLSALPPSTVVVLDAETGEVLAEHPVELVEP
ncbi:hypothetical protein [Cellulosimicrobium protaetiae]|uniref:Uncharacterized protein n=1 Tax=Cellulosimicrobium protaetiae TaxID=2587808 RepID=A0A6M5UDH5_9MICO|nr:hypothetical protein [Cellulosimicrobium protaetiae]QJW35401.1 hypothetical protein FIC82_003470 [Cellulosimicrobium protaetiae]